jgi:hypothetical protein
MTIGESCIGYPMRNDMGVRHRSEDVVCRTAPMCRVSKPVRPLQRYPVPLVLQSGWGKFASSTVAMVHRP